MQAAGSARDGNLTKEQCLALLKDIMGDEEEDEESKEEQLLNEQFFLDWHAAVASLNPATGEMVTPDEFNRTNKILQEWLNSPKSMEKALEMLPPQVRATLEKIESFMESDPTG